jgi:Ca2+-binding EF-hand superfamily protein
VEDVRKLHWQFKNCVHGLALVEPQFECVMALKKDSMGDVSLAAVFQALDNDKDGRIDALEFLGGLTLVCRGTFEEKARLCFELFDFNLNADLSRNELVMMMQSTICGMICLSGGTEETEPGLEDIERLADEAFELADMDKSKSITYSEFVAWARSNREVMGCLESIVKVNQESVQLEDTDDSAEEVGHLSSGGLH